MTEQKQIKQNEPVVPEEDLTPKKKRAMLEYMTIMFAAAFLLVAVSLLVKVHSMQNDLDAASTGAHDSIVEMENTLESMQTENEALRNELTAMENNAKAAELLALAQNALNTGKTVDFHAYMAELEGYADALPESAAAIYAGLLEALS